MVDYQKKTVAELQEILKSRSLPHTGKKAELVARLSEADKAQANGADEPPAPESTSEVPPPESETQQARGETGTGTDPQITQKSEVGPAQADREASGNTDANLAQQVDYSMGIARSEVDDEIKKRKARAERFGVQLDMEAEKAAERAKRFGTGSDSVGVKGLDEALPMENPRKRGRGDGGPGRGRRRRFNRDRPRDASSRVRDDGGIRKSSSAFSNDTDRTAAEARRKRFAA